MNILDNFEVFQVARSFSIAEVNVLKNKISFNIHAASELGYPEYIRVFISRDKTQIAIQPCAKTTPNAMKFFDGDDVRQKRRRTIPTGNRALATLIKSGMGWEMSQNFCAPGVRFGGDNIIIFDLRQAYRKGKESRRETGLCVIQRTAAPFYELPTRYFSDEPMTQSNVIDVDGVVMSA